MDTGLTRTYQVELFFDERPELDQEALRKSLKARVGIVEPLETGEQSTDLLAFFLHNHAVEFKGGQVPVQTAMHLVEGPPNFDKLAPALGQSFHWTGAREALAGCRYTMLIHDLWAIAMPYKARMELFHQIVQAVMEIAKPRALYWPLSQLLTEPGDYLASQELEPKDLLNGAVSLRFFHVDGRPGEMIVDTLGLAVHGLPDVQCHFAGLDPNEVGSHLYNIAHYLFDHGDLIEDGHTIEGTMPGEKWRCRRELSLVGPERVVLNLDTGTIR
ncbi:DUF4261 domain-containing protein [Tumebacillus sp. BK434]|uniref:DUF4261 domain-containing protein n=1 Tax=Tumebacillus sp. BK434 TaxID=2512169 RepID=UPI001404FBAF|nr:DUF4261 domain-containing protein [Tumebacillus sp. BK434]